MTVKKELNVSLDMQDTMSAKTKKAADVIKSTLIRALESTQQASIRTERAQQTLQKTVEQSNLSLSAKKKIVQSLNRDMERGDIITEHLAKQNEKLIQTIKGVNKESSFDAMATGLKNVAGIALATVGAFTGIAVIDKTFKPVDAAIGGLTNSMNRLMWHSDELISDFHAYGPITKRVTNAFNSLRTKGIEVYASAMDKLSAKRQLSLIDETAFDRTASRISGRAVTITDSLKKLSVQGFDYTREKFSAMSQLMVNGGQKIASASKYAFDQSAKFMQNFGPNMLSVADKADQVAQTVGYKLKTAFNDFRNKGLSGTIQGLSMTKKSLQATRASLMIYTKSAENSFRIIKDSASIFGQAAKHTEFFHKSLGGVIARAGIASSAFTFLGAKLLQADGVIAKMSGVTLIALGVALGGAIALVHQLLIKLSNVVTVIGDNLTKASVKQIEAFSEAEKTTYAFNQTLTSYAKNTDDAQKSVARWTTFVDKASDATGATRSSLRALVAETVGATHAYHLNEKQMESLINRSIDLSERAHQPAIDTLTALIKAMGGNTAGLAIYGLHLDETAIQQSKLNKEMKKNFKNLNSVEKGQARYSILMEQAGKAAGYATANATLYSKSVKIQKNAVKSLNEELGKGAAIINGQYTYGVAQLTTAFTSLLKPILPIVGFFQAILGRVAQLGGMLIRHTFTVLLLVSSYKALNVLLGKLGEKGAFEKRIPFINKSVGDLTRHLGVTKVELSSVGKVAKTSLRVIAAQMVKTMASFKVSSVATFDLMNKKISKSIKRFIAMRLAALSAGRSIHKNFGMKVKSAMLLPVKGTKKLAIGIKAVAAGFQRATLAAWKFVGTPVGAILTGVVVVSVLLYKAIQMIDQRTGIFTKTWNKLKEAFKQASPIVEFFVGIWLKLATVMSTIFLSAVKLVAAALSKMIQAFVTIVKGMGQLTQYFSSILPDSMVMSEETIAKLQKTADDMGKTASDLLSESGSDLLNMFVSTANAADNMSKSIDSIPLEVLQKEYEKTAKAAEKAFEFTSGYTPKMDLAKFEADSEKFKKKLLKLKDAAEKLKIKLASSENAGEELKEVEDKIRFTSEALKGIELKRAQEIRTFKLQELDLELQQRRNKIITVEFEVSQKKKQMARDERSWEIEVELEKQLQLRGIRDAENLLNLDAKKAAILKANEIELRAYMEMLEHKRKLAVSNAEKRKLEELKIREGQLKGGETDETIDAQKNVKIAQEEQYFAQITSHRAADESALKAHKQRLLQIESDAYTRKAQLAISQQQAYTQMLGTDEAGIQAQLELKKQQDELELEQLRTKLQGRQDLEVLYENAKEERQIQRQLLAIQLKEQHAQQEVAILRMQGKHNEAQYKEDNAKFRKNMRERGAIYAFFEDNRVKAAQGALQNIASIGSAFGRSGFKIAQKAAIGNATINAFKAATGAYSAMAGIPIVGPGLGVAAAAAALAAGYANIRRIKAQKYSGQAHAGVNEVPQSMKNTSWIVKGGERIVQPEANKDLTSFIKDNRSAGKGPTFNINVYGEPNESTLERLKRTVMDAMREASERGEPVLSENGIVRA